MKLSDFKQSKVQGVNAVYILKEEEEKEFQYTPVMYCPDCKRIIEVVIK